MKKLNAIWKYISDVGVDKSYSYSKKLKISLINQAMFIALFVILFSGLESSINQEKGAWIVWTLALIPIIIILLNFFRKFRLANITLTVLFPIAILEFIILYGLDLGIQYFYFVLLLGVLLSYKNKYTQFFNSLFIFTLLVLGIYYCKHYPNIYENDVSIYDGILCIAFNVILLFHGVGSTFKGILQKERQLRKTVQNLDLKYLELNESIVQNENKNNLLSILAHDLLGPSRSFNNLTDKISFLIKGKEFDEIQKLGDYFDSTGKTLFNNIDNLLKWSIAQSKNFTVKYETFSLQPLIDQIWEQQAIVYEEMSPVLNSSIPDILTVKTDKTILTIVLTNLISNAIKYSNSAPIIDIYSPLHTSSFELVISNPGEVMPEQILGSIHTHQLLPPSIVKGHGIGLLLCKELISKINGDITFEVEHKKVIVTIKIS